MSPTRPDVQQEDLGALGPDPSVQTNQDLIAACYVAGTTMEFWTKII